MSQRTRKCPTLPSLSAARIYRVTDQPDSPWFWGVSFRLTRRKSYGHAASLNGAKAATAPSVHEAKAAFVAEVSKTSRRLLELLAQSANGATGALLVAHGFTLDRMVAMVRAGRRAAS